MGGKYAFEMEPCKTKKQLEHERGQKGTGIKLQENDGIDAGFSVYYSNSDHYYNNNGYNHYNRLFNNWFAATTIATAMYPSI